MKASRVVLVTGATGALGGAVAERFVQSGARVALTGRNVAKLDALVERLAPTAGDRIWAHPADLADAKAVAGLIEALTAQWGGADVLLNNTGGWRAGARVAELTDDTWDAMLTINLRTALNIGRAVLPHMVAKGWGRIVNVGSRAAVEPGATGVSYSIAKAGVVTLTQSIAAGYGDKGITANVILPSTIATEANRRAMPKADASRMVSPEAIAETMLHLCSEAAASINGACIPMYGRGR